MKIRISFICILLTSFLVSKAQQSVTGRVVNESGHPMIDILVCQIQTNRCTMTNGDGIYKLDLEFGSPGILLFASKGFVSTLYALRPGEVILPDVVLQKDSTLDERIALHYRIKKREFVALTFEFPVYVVDFDAFEHLLGGNNTKMIESAIPLAVVGLRIPIEKTSISAGYGLIERLNDRNDSIGRKLTNQLVQVKVGYSLLEYKRLNIDPEIGFGWVRRRLQNYSTAERIPLEEYLYERTMDLRFHDFVLMTGLNTSFKILKSNMQFYEYLSLGISGGYLAQLNRNTILRSNGNKLTTHLRAPYENYYFSINLTVAM